MENDNLMQCASDVSSLMQKAVEETKKDSDKGGLFSMLSLLSNPESQQTLRFLLQTGANLQKAQQ